LRAAGAQPFLAVALYALTPVADATQPTFAVDQKWRLYVNPDRLNEWTVLESAGVLLHEVGHLIRDHAGRARTLDVRDEVAGELWNIAADAEINDDLLSAGVDLPATPVTPGRLGERDGLTAEYYYSRLREMDVVPDAGWAHCGAGCHGLDSENPGDVAGVPGLSGVESMLLRKRTAEAVMAAVASGQGNVGGGWIRWAEAHLRPQLDWRTLLAASVRSGFAAVTGNADYSYRRPSRRRVPGVVLPSMHRPLPRVAIVVDTSGSVGESQLETAWTEVHGCLRRLGARRDLLSVYAADVDLHRLSGAPARQMALVGGGGTDMAAAIDQVLSISPRPDLFVVITDGFTPWPASRPSRPVIVVLLPTNVGSPEPPPSWAKVIAVTAPESTR
jgi:predicted metal-dependent peptidase